MQNNDNKKSKTDKKQKQNKNTGKKKTFLFLKKKYIPAFFTKKQKHKKYNNKIDQKKIFVCFC